MRGGKGIVDIDVAELCEGGDEVRIWNTRGEFHCTAKISSDLQPGVCLLPKGLWHRHMQNGRTANVVIPEGFADLGGQIAWNDARVQVAKR